MEIIDITPPPGTPMPLLVLVRGQGFHAVDLQPGEIKHAMLDAEVLPEAVTAAHRAGIPVEHWVDTGIKVVSPLAGWLVRRAREQVARSAPAGPVV